HEAAMVAQLHDAEVRCQRRERVVRNFRRCGGHGGEERRLPCVRLADEPDVCDELQLERDPARLALAADFPLARCTIRRRRERGIAAPAATAFRDDQLLPILDQLAEHVAGCDVAHDRTDRYAQNEIRTVLARPVLPLSVLAPLRAVALLVAVVEERRELCIRAQDAVTAPPAVAARGAAERHERLAPPRLRTRAAGPGLHIDLYVVDEHLILRTRCGRAPSARPAMRAPHAPHHSLRPRSRASPRRLPPARPPAMHRAGASRAARARAAPRVARRCTARASPAAGRDAPAPSRTPRPPSTSPSRGAACERSRAAARTGRHTRGCTPGRRARPIPPSSPASVAVQPARSSRATGRSPAVPRDSRRTGSSAAAPPRHAPPLPAVRPLRVRSRAAPDPAARSSQTARRVRGRRHACGVSSTIARSSPTF